ncbi:MAG: phytanoyl-CoA dioxygenase family protein [Acidobacteria bacterium]|nr:phytanoyl-CoA dioxygenase family protein [Acidobacteriota bacterium]
MRSHDVRRLRDRALDRRLDIDGYVVVRVADDDTIARALDVYHRFDSGIDDGYYASIHSTNRRYKEDVDRELRQIVWPPCDEVLHDHECLVAAMMVKPPTGSTVVPVHQDWNTIDESRGAGLTCWMPLTPITRTEGLMRVLPGSHHYLQGLRGSPGFPNPYQDIAERIDAELMIDVEVQVGEVMIMDGRVLHTTGPNESGRTRVAAYMNSIPRGAQPLHFYRREDGGVEGYRVDRAFFTSFNIGERPTGELFLELDRYERPTITMPDLLRMHRATRRPFARRPERQLLAPDRLGSTTVA